MSANKDNRLAEIRIIPLLLVVFAITCGTSAYPLLANERPQDSIDLQDKRYFDLLKTGSALEKAGKLNEALKIYYTSLSIERYEAYSYYAMIDIGRIYLEKNNYPAAIFFLKSYILKVERELTPGTPYAGFAPEARKQLIESKKKAEKMLRKAIKNFCLEVNDEFLCNKVKPYDWRLEESQTK